MSDALKDARDSIALFEHQLVVGNHDSITFLGNEEQTMLRNLSRTLVGLYTTDQSNESESMLREAISEIEKYEGKTKRSFFPIRNIQKELKKEYEKMRVCVGEIYTAFRVQQASILKETKLLEKLSANLDSCIDSLEECIYLAQTTLQGGRLPKEETDISDNTSSSVFDTEDQSLWYKRLDGRVDELNLSLTIARQDQIQIRLLHENGLALLERISLILSNTIPVWQNQVTMQKSIIHFSEINDQLKKELRETLSMEKQDKDIRNKLKETTNDL